MVRVSGGLDPLVVMAKDQRIRENKPLLAAVTGAIWKTAISPENVDRFDQLRTVEVRNISDKIDIFYSLLLTELFIRNNLKS